MASRQYLHGRNNQSQLRWFLQAGAQPSPLRFPQHGLGGIIIRQIAFPPRRAALIRDAQRRAKPARIQQNDLHALPRRADGQMVI